MADYTGKTQQWTSAGAHFDKSKDEARERIARQTAEFIANGGTVSKERNGDKADRSIEAKHGQIKEFRGSMRGKHR